MAQFAVVVEGIETLADVRDYGKRIKIVSVQAVNKVARDQRAEAAKRIGEQINLPKRYLGPSAGRLTVTQQATRNRLEARITARGRPTSLARFSKGSPGGRGGVTVEVHKGQARRMKRAFLIRLPQGSSLTETRFNLGLAMRLRPGESVNNKIRQVQLSKGLVLLYGPSIQQVFLDNQGKGVAADIAEPTAKKLEAEVFRLLGL